ncbi:DUF6941 family protein [Naasia lichenicola]|uniref:Uncharacterized protein n=1 Tax=Naasia lichenicola TaxID=2565933 RepID=A0A4S4FTC3_9MICO|nr:hypothetical protein [Naasia lichenicola]THG33005.1 hypothetical protein E6C64_01170 [Naasia lichenicola]
MKTIVLLADSAQTDSQGKIHALGLGWSFTGSPTPPAAIVVLIEVDWNETNRRYKLEADLVDEDGQPVLVPGPFGHVPMHFEAEYELGRPPGVIPGTPLSIPMAVPISGGMALTPGKRYTWVVKNSGQPNDELGVSFSIRPEESTPL